MNDLQKLHNWVFNKEKENPQTHFSAGEARDIAKEFDFLLHKLNHSSPYYNYTYDELLPYIIKIDDIKEYFKVFLIYEKDLIKEGDRVLIGDFVYKADSVDIEQDEDVKIFVVYFERLPQYYYDK